MLINFKTPLCHSYPYKTVQDVKKYHVAISFLFVGQNI